MKTNFENMNWRLSLLGDHALVFSLEEKMSEEIIEKIKNYEAPKAKWDK